MHLQDYKQTRLFQIFWHSLLLIALIAITFWVYSQLKMGMLLNQQKQSNVQNNVQNLIKQEVVNNSRGKTNGKARK